MRFVDPHAHMVSRTYEDYERMALAQVEVVVEPAFWSGVDRRHAGAFYHYFDHLTRFEPTRAAEFGIRHHCMIAVNPKTADNKELALEVLEEVDEYVQRDNVVGIGEIGFNLQTDNEEVVFRRQLEIAMERDLLILIHLPHTVKPKGTERTVRILEEMGTDPEKVIIDHNEETTMDISRSLEGVWCGLTIYPRTKLSIRRGIEILEKWGTDRMLINAAGDWGYSDPMRVPKMALQMKLWGWSEEEIQKVTWQNPVDFFSRSPNFRTGWAEGDRDADPYPGYGTLE